MNPLPTPKPILKGFKLGKLELPNPVFYAPLAGCSDYPFRKMSAQYGPGLMYCEMVKMDALVRNDTGTFHLLDYDKSMHPIGAQLCGSKPEIAGKAARMLEELGFDVIDFNCGCPVDKVTKDGSGSGMLRTPALIGDILANIIAAVSIPVTVKIRAGWDEQSINAPQITQIAESAGAAAICIHGRTRQQAYKGPANWEWIRQCKQVAKSIKVIGNGDVMDPFAAERMFATTGCDAVLVSRGTLGAPWIAEDILRHLRGEAPIQRTLEKRRQALYEHFLHTVHYHHDRKAAIEMRRVGCWYVKKSNGTRAFREQMSRANSVEAISDLILNFPFGPEEEFSQEGPSEETCE